MILDFESTRLITIAMAVFAGVFLSILAHYMRIPAIAPLLVGGVILGPEVLGFVETDSLGHGLRLIISLAVAIVLFEGGLTLELSGFTKRSRVISRLLTIGVLITWIGTAIGIYFLFNFSLPFSILAGSLIIVTGPTVINPLLQRIQIKEELHQILLWEGVLIDPIGVFIAVLCFEWISIEGTNILQIGLFMYRLLIGITFGILGGFGAYQVLKRRWVPDEQVNIFILGWAILMFGISDLFVHEAGILTVVVNGFILGWKKPEQLKIIKQFKSELTELSIGILFILLSANLNLDEIRLLGRPGIILIIIVLILIRPLSIFVCSYKSDLGWREKTFLSWIAPRGVVAGAMASLFTLELGPKVSDASFLQSFTFSIIAVTIIVQGLTSGLVARILKVKAKPKHGWVIVGVHYFSMKVAEFISKTSGGKCILVDRNPDAVVEAQRMGFTAIQGDALSTRVIPDDLVPLIGNVLALTDNRALNQLTCERWSDVVMRDHLYRWAPNDSDEKNYGKNTGTAVWQQLAKPSKLAYDLKNKEVVLIRSKFDRVPSRLIKGTVPLMAWADDQLTLGSFDWENKGEGQALLFQHLAHHLPFYVHSQHILRLEIKSFEKLLKTTLQHARITHPHIPYNSTLASLMERELALPTMLSNGVSVPHARTEGLKEPLCLIVKVPEGIELGDDKKIYRLFFVLLSPADDPEIHLLLLADIARIATDIDLVERLLETQTTDELFSVLRHY